MWITMFGDTTIDTPKECTEKINYRFINGKEKNRKYCEGFCNNPIHRGCLTKGMIAKHGCLEKECTAFYVDTVGDLPKYRREEAKAKRRNQKALEEMVAQTNELIDVEGIRVVSAKRDGNESWIFDYITIASIDMDDVLRRLRERFGENLTMVEKYVDFDTAAKIVFE